MPSKLIGLKRKLDWSEFRGNPTPAELQALQTIAGNASGKTVGMAGIKSNFTVNFGGKKADEPVLNPDPGSSPQTFSLADDIIVTVTFDEARSWKRIQPLSDKGKELLLDHEQGHYDISALMARDCFIDLMQLKSNSYSSKQAGETEAKDIVNKYKNKLPSIQAKYDDDTTHGAWVTPSFLPERKESFQTKWENFLHVARTQARFHLLDDTILGPVTPVAPDGAVYKIRLLTVLANGGFTF